MGSSVPGSASPRTVVARVPDVLTTEVAGDLVLLSDELRYLSLSHVGREIWSLLEEPRSVQDVVEDLVRRYDVSPDRCAAEVLEFVDQLHRHGVVSIA